MRHETSGTPAAMSGAARVAVFLLFIASGMAGLIYEVVWSRLLTYRFGATLLAVSTVLAAFMGGMALGSFALGRVADRLRRPLLFYAVLEVFIAASALAAPWALEALEPWNRAVMGDFSSPLWIRNLYRFGVTFAVLLVPTTLMGATLPALSRFLARRRETLGMNIGGLYAANTTGAVLGAFLAGFFLIEALGIVGVQYLAAGLNALVFAIGATMSRRLEAAPAAMAVQEPEPEADSPSPASRRLYRVVLITYGISGFAALAYQVIWTRGLVLFTTAIQSSTYAFSAMLTVFLTGLALGSAVMTAWIDRQERPARLYALIQFGLGASGGLSALVLFHVAPVWAPFASAYAATGASPPFLVSLLETFAKTIAVMGLPTFLMGMAFPAAARLCVPDLKRVGAGVGRLYAVNTIGAIAGAFASGFVLIPALGLSNSIFLLMAVNLALGLIVVFADEASGRTYRAAFAIATLAAGVLFIMRKPSARESVRLALSPMGEMIAYEEGSMATVTVTRNPVDTREIQIDTIGVAGTDRIMLTDQKSLAHLPGLLLPSPESVLTVGFGSGGASYSYTLYEELTDVHCVEIADTMLNRDIQRLLEKSNHLILDRMDRGELPQYRVFLADARSYLRFTPMQYDSIATDCTDLRYKTNANLYDLEYFRLCRDRITDDGMVVVWMPLGGLSEDLFLLTLNTFQQAFPDMHVWYYNNDTIHYCLLAGFKERRLIDYGEVVSRLSRPEIRRDLAEIGLDDPDKILGGYVTGGEPLARLLEGRRINSETHPVLEFEAPRSEYGKDLIWSNLNALYENRQSVVELIDPATLPAESRERIQRMEEAAPTIARGLAAHSNVDFYHAAKHYAAARDIAPDDPSVDYLIGFRKERFWQNHEPLPGPIHGFLGEAEFSLAEEGIGSYADTLSYLLPVLRRSPEDLAANPLLHDAWKSALVYAGLSLIRLDRVDEAAPILKAAARETPRHPRLRENRPEIEAAGVELEEEG